MTQLDIFVRPLCMTHSQNSSSRFIKICVNKISETVILDCSWVTVPAFTSSLCNSHLTHQSLSGGLNDMLRWLSIKISRHFHSFHSIQSITTTGPNLNHNVISSVLKKTFSVFKAICAGVLPLLGKVSDRSTLLKETDWSGILMVNRFCFTFRLSVKVCLTLTISLQRDTLLGMLRLSLNECWGAAQIQSQHSTYALPTVHRFIDPD